MPPKSTKRKYEPLKKKNFDLQADVLDKLASNDINCWIDGACKGNPGPAGSGCFMQVPKLTIRSSAGTDPDGGASITTSSSSTPNSGNAKDSKEVKPSSSTVSMSSSATGAAGASDITLDAIDFGDHKFVGVRSTNSVSELLAVELALDMRDKIEEKLGIKLTNPINLMTDSTYCRGAFTGNAAKANPEIIQRIKNRIQLLAARGVKVTFYWVEAHCGIYGNEMADWLANQAVWLSGVDIIPKYLAEFRKSGLAEYLGKDTFSAVNWQSVVRVPHRLWEVTEVTEESTESGTEEIVNSFIRKRTSAQSAEKLKTAVVS